MEAHSVGREFQYRKWYEVTCDIELVCEQPLQRRSFNTASGMRSHATVKDKKETNAEQGVSIPQAV